MARRAPAALTASPQTARLGEGGRREGGHDALRSAAARQATPNLTRELHVQTRGQVCKVASGAQGRGESTERTRAGHQCAAACTIRSHLPGESHFCSVTIARLTMCAQASHTNYHVQANDLVPIVEPELLIDGDHSIQTFADTSARVVAGCVAALWQQPGLSLDAVLLKPQMCIPGADFQGEKPSPEAVAEHTLRVMRRYPERRDNAEVQAALYCLS